MTANHWFTLNEAGDAIWLTINGRVHELPISWHIRGETIPASDVVTGEKGATAMLTGQTVDGRMRLEHAGAETTITMRASTKRSQTLGINELGFSLRLPPGTSVWALQRRFTEADTPVGTSLANYFTYGCLKAVMFEIDGQSLLFACKWAVGKAFTAGTIERDQRGWILHWRWEPKAPFAQAVDEMPGVSFGLFNSSVEAAKDYQRWIAAEYGLVPRAESPAIPKWFHDVRCVIGLWMKTNDGTVVHDYGDVQRLLEEMKRLGVAPNTMLYLLGWDGAYGVRHGYFEPDGELGGASGLQKACAMARQFGYRVMVHASLYLVDKTTELFRRFLDASIRDGYYREAHWPYSQQECYTMPVPIGLLSPAHGAYREDRLNRLIRVLQLGVDGLMYDSIDGQPNDPIHGDTHAGNVAIYEALRRAHPECVQTCETPTERVFPFVAGFALGAALDVMQVGERRARGGGVYDFEPYRAMTQSTHYLFAHDGGFPLAVDRPGSRYNDVPENFDRMIELQQQRDDFRCVQLNYRQYGIDEKAKEIILGR